MQSCMPARALKTATSRNLVPVVCVLIVLTLIVMLKLRWSRFSLMENKCQEFNMSQTPYRHLSRIEPTNEKETRPPKEQEARNCSCFQCLEEKPVPLRVVASGENIQVGESTEVHVMSAIRRMDYPLRGALNVVLLTWTGDRETDRDSFFCCLMDSPNADQVVEVPAVRRFQQPGFKGIDMRYVLYGCSVRFRPSDGISAKDLHYVAFAEKSCEDSMTMEAHKIVVPKDGRNKFAVCKGFAYGYIEPQRLVEWFEFVRVVGVSMVQVFYHIINDSAMTVLRYYQQTGFLILLPVTPAARKGSPPRGFQQPRNDKQAWMDKRVILNDCLHRLSGYDYVGVVDFDELLMPSPPFTSLWEVLQDASTRNPKTGVFFAHAYLTLLNWPETHSAAAISFLRRQDRTVNDSIDNVLGHRSSPKIIFRPRTIVGIDTHTVSALVEDYEGQDLPRESYSFRHFRTCKKDVWGRCDMRRILDQDTLRFRAQWLRALSRLPLMDLGCSQGYVINIKRELRQLKQKESG